MGFASASVSASASASASSSGFVCLVSWKTEDDNRKHSKEREYL